jgi:glyoxylase-like metal-dependent hydrolase (beta-lactamase superfamily II)
MSDLQILSFSLGEHGANCYIVADKAKKEAVIIDPADAGEFLVEKVSQYDLSVKRVLATHGHFDHILAATYLQLALDVPFYVHREDEFLVKRMKDSATHFLGRDPGPSPKVSGYIAGGDKINIGKLSIEIIDTPGHTPGSVTFLVENAAFVGDLIFAGGAVGRTDFKYANEEKLNSSIDKIFSLPKETLILPGHGQSSLVGKELEYHSVMSGS